MIQETASHHGGPQAVRAARRDEAALLGDVLADAVAEDPVFAWLSPPGLPGRDSRLRTFFTSMSRGYLRLGKPCYLTSGASAAALWASPKAWAMPLSQVILEAVPSGLAFRRRLLRALRTQLQPSVTGPPSGGCGANPNPGSLDARGRESSARQWVSAGFSGVGRVRPRVRSFI
ncbi:MAG TPA: hypothetical protein VMA73_06005 [Streptosporangiaceae bacterium]|nr:hypothetical protein [Streptosporangiaceae bacterium]